jgi:hypothetical protein
MQHQYEGFLLLKTLEVLLHIKIEKELIISDLHLLTNYILTEKHSH